VIAQLDQAQETLAKKYAHSSDKLDALKRAASELGKVVQRTKAAPKMAALKAKMVQIKRDEQHLLQLQGQLDNVAGLKRQLQDTAMNAETLRVIKLAVGLLKRTATSVEEIDGVMFDSEDLIKQHRETSEAMSKPIDTGEMPMDEDELWAALEGINQEVDGVTQEVDGGDAQLLRELQELDVEVGGLDVEVGGLPSPAAPAAAAAVVVGAVDELAVLVALGD